MAFNPPIGNRTKEEILSMMDTVRNPFEIALYGSGNPYNIGGLIRSAHNFMVSKIHLIDVDKTWNKKAAMTSLQWEKNRLKYHTLDSFLEYSENRNVISFEHRDGLKTEDLRSFRYPSFPILVFGSEKTGVPDCLLSISLSIVHVPMFGLVLDHNVCMAASMAMYDFSCKEPMNSPIVKKLTEVS